MRLTWLVSLAVVVAGAAGCGQEDDEGDVRSVIANFYSALEAGDAQAACDQLSADTRSQLESQQQRGCRDAVGELDLRGGETTRVEVFMTSAKVDLSSGESAFLDRGAQGWRLAAVGCRPEDGKPAERPFECEAEA